MITIKVEGKNVADLLRLECVRGVQKMPKNNIKVSVRTIVSREGREAQIYAYIGDTIEVESEQSKTGTIIFQNS